LAGTLNEVLKNKIKDPVERARYAEIGAGMLDVKSALAYQAQLQQMEQAQGLVRPQAPAAPGGQTGNPAFDELDKL